MSEYKSLTDKKSNRLIYETSPYLLQHAHNPVDWNPWGPEALQQAKDQNKPILLSIGYAACHWCHVMAHESFEDPETAQLMNQYFINIKVDREERPDLDEIYMRAVQALSGHGGWPMTMFLTPQLKPFFGGTYFPPVDRYNMPSFKTVLTSIAGAWSQQRQRIEQSSTQIISYLASVDFIDQSSTGLSYTQITDAVKQILSIFDRQYGGLGSAPKFPHCYATELIMRAYIHEHVSIHEHPDTHEPPKDSAPNEYQEFIETTLNRMACGGIHDQIGGGFARYSVDRQWLVPHFEKMLYDNAGLAKNYLCGYQIFKNEYWKNVAIDCLDFVIRELSTADGAFYSSLDADSEGEEGKFYVWTPEQTINVLGKEDGQWLNTVYGISPGGNFEHGTSVLSFSKPSETLAQESNVSLAEFWARLNPLRQKLFESRSKRIRPATDEKVITSWNALMISSYVKGFQVLGATKYLQAAIGAMQFILANMHLDNRLLRTWAKGKAHLNGYLDDYTFTVQALLDLASVDSSPVWLSAAQQLNEVVLSHFFDPQSNSFFYTSNDHEELIMRTRNNFDGPLPSSTSVAVMNLLRLARIIDDAGFYSIAENVLRQCSSQFERASDQYSNTLCVLDLYLSNKMELVIVTKPSGPQEKKDMFAAANSSYLPNLITVMTDGTQTNDSVQVNSQGHYPILANRVLKDNKTTAYLCHNFACQAPITDPSKLAVELRQ